MASDRFSCGLDVGVAKDLNAVLEYALGQDFEFVTIPLVHPRLRREFLQGPVVNRDVPLTRSDTLLLAKDWSLCAGRVSPWIELDSPVRHVQRNSEKALLEEINYSHHLNIPAIIVPLKHGAHYNLARVLHQEYATQHFNQVVWMHFALCEPRGFTANTIHGAEEKDVDPEDSECYHEMWRMWNDFRTLCGTLRNLGVALEVTADLPSEEIVKRWIGEPVRVIVIPTHVFLSNKRGYPVLSRAHQSFVRRFMKLKLQFIITGQPCHDKMELKFYYQYLRHLYQLFQTQPPLDPLADFAKGYDDYLQTPLQPLMDNLDANTYEIFEKDHFKYAQYEKAVYCALMDRVPKERINDVVTIIMVVGSGRGPIVTASLRAADAAGMKVRVYAVEKNPNAIVTLRNKKIEEWGDRVDVVCEDMRLWNPPEFADIIVSELLGSFGDNELSPECLDGAQRLLKENGISIPCSYSSYISPLQSCKIYSEVDYGQIRDTENPWKPFEVPYVVRLTSRYEIDEAKPLFTFNHPNHIEPIDNTRAGEVTFTAKVDSVMHGIAGYFHTVLYGDVTLSTVPKTHSPGMFSWFPIFFPLLEPVNIKANDTVKIRFWRCVSDKKVWYEWCLAQPEATVIHNPKGRSYWIGL